MTTPTAHEALARLIELDSTSITMRSKASSLAWADAIAEARQALAPEVAILGEQWHEDDGPVLWWLLPVMDLEAPWAGTPNGSDWPGYHTHFTRLPPAPVAPTCTPERPHG